MVKLGLFSKGLMMSLICFSIHANAQNSKVIVKDSLKLSGVFSQESVPVDSTAVEDFPALQTIVNDVSDDIDSSFINTIDALREKWYIENIDSTEYVDSDKLNQIKFDRISFPDTLITKKMDSLNSAIQLTNNSIVRSYINFYTLKKREQVCNMLGLAEYYFPMFEEELDRQGLPLELKYLPVIESALNPIAFSRVGACGLWQFMYPTGRQYKLNIDSYIDERRDPVKSTKAAVAYLKDLYGIYGDWMLVIAAYNCGQGNVNKAIRRSGGKANYWDIYYSLPRETRGYVPTFIAAMYVFNYSEQYNLYPIKSDFPPLCDTVMIRQKLHFEQIAQVVKMPMEQIIELNPQYKRNIVPANSSRPLSLKMPYNYVADFVQMHDSVLAHNRVKYFDNKDRLVDPKDRLNNSRDRFQQIAHNGPSDRTKIYYKVRSGDVLGTLANKFNVRLSDLRYWNKIKRNRIQVGQRLVVYVPNNKVNSVNEDSNSNEIAEASNAQKSDFVYHKVRRGENLWTIARKYKGVSNKDIMEWNDIKNAKLVKPGLRLKIKI